MKIETIIISAFPGTGKTYSHKLRPGISLDSDSSNFSWVYENGEKKRNPNFPANYIQHIKKNIGKYHYIFVSSHDIVRDALIKNKIKYYLLFPEINRKSEFIEKYKTRGNDQQFIQLLDKNWNSWINDMVNIDNNYVKKYELKHPISTVEDFLLIESPLKF